MATTHFSQNDLNQQFELSPQFRNLVFLLIGLGIVLILAGVLFAPSPDAASHAADDHAALVENTLSQTVADDHGEEGGHHGHTVTLGTRIVSNLLLCGLYFFTIAMGSLFFLVIHRVGNAGWHTAIRRVPEAIISYLPIGVVSLTAVFFFMNSIYEWAWIPEGVDAIIDTKRGYLNKAFFIARNALYFAIWAFGAWYLRKLSVDADRENPDGAVAKFHRSGTFAAGFLVFYALSYTLFAVDWIKSLEPHWFSTIFGIYVFAGSMVSSMVVTYLLIVFLKRQGYMQWVNGAHFHDLGKYTFGFCVFWAYIWVAQYLLIWYSNIPEEGIYYVKRYRVEDHEYLGYAFFFYANVAINFIIPFLVLMTRNAKRYASIYIPVGILLLYGHWHDLFLMIMPGAMGYNPGVGLIEVGFFVMFWGIFLFAVLTGLTRSNLAAVNHPYMEESLNHSTGPV